MEQPKDSKESQESSAKDEAASKTESNPPKSPRHAGRTFGASGVEKRG